MFVNNHAGTRGSDVMMTSCEHNVGKIKFIIDNPRSAAHELTGIASNAALLSNFIVSVTWCELFAFDRKSPIEVLA